MPPKCIDFVFVSSSKLRNVQPLPKKMINCRIYILDVTSFSDDLLINNVNTALIIVVIAAANGLSHILGG